MPRACDSGNRSLVATCRTVNPAGGLPATPSWPVCERGLGVARDRISPPRAPSQVRPCQEIELPGQAATVRVGRWPNLIRLGHPARAASPATGISFVGPCCHRSCDSAKPPSCSYRLVVPRRAFWSGPRPGILGRPDDPAWPPPNQRTGLRGRTRFKKVLD